MWSREYTIDRMRIYANTNVRYTLSDLKVRGTVGIERHLIQ